MPNPLELFNTQTLLPLIDESEDFRPKTALQNTFFPPSGEIKGEYVQVDIIKGARRVAPFVNPKVGGKLVEKQGYVSRLIKPPYVEMLGESNAHDILKRRAGEIGYRQSGMTPVQAAAEDIGKMLIEQLYMLDRRVEIMCAEAMRTGKITITGVGVDAQVDYLRDAALDIVLAGADLWDAGTSNPINDILEWKILVLKKSGQTLTDIMLGDLALAAFLNNAAVQKLLDNRRFEIGNVVTQDLPSGLTYYGSIHGVNIYSYVDFYLDDAGVAQPMIGEKEVVGGCKMAKNSLAHGSIMDVEAGESKTPYFVKTWIVPHPSAMWLKLASSPLPCLSQPDTTFRATVLA